MHKLQTSSSSTKQVVYIYLNLPCSTNHLVYNSMVIWRNDNFQVSLSLHHHEWAVEAIGSGCILIRGRGHRDAAAFCAMPVLYGREIGFLGIHINMAASS